MARLLALVALLAAVRVSADPLIEVRGRLRLELERAEHSHHSLVLEGRLLEEATSEPMPGGTVAVRLGALDDTGRETTIYAYAAPVDVDGVFRFMVDPITPRRYVVHLSSGAVGLHDAAAPVERELDLARRTIELRLFAPPEAAADAATVPVSVEVVALDGAGDARDTIDDELPVDLAIDGTGIATLLVKHGHATADVPLHARAGQEVGLKATFTGNDAFGPAEATARVRLVEPTTLTLAADAPRVTLGGEVTLRGVLRIGERTVGGLPILVRLAGADDGAERGATVTTAPDGTFEAKLRAPASGTRAGFEAVFRDEDAKPRGLPAATSEVVVVELVPGFSLVDLGARPAGAALVVAGVLLAILALLRLGAALAMRKTLPKAPVVAPAPRPRATLRTAGDRRLFGRVLDEERRGPVASAQVTVTIEEKAAAVATLTDGDGAFHLDPPDGAATLRVEARGFAPQELRGRIPHRGEWAPIEVELTPLRAELLRRYGAALATSLPAHEKLGPRTPRELARLALRHRPSLDPNALGALRSWVEVACFGPEAPPVDSLDRLGKLVDELHPR